MVRSRGTIFQRGPQSNVGFQNTDRLFLLWKVSQFTVRTDETSYLGLELPVALLHGPHADDDLASNPERAVPLGLRGFARVVMRT